MLPSPKLDSVSGFVLMIRIVQYIFYEEWRTDLIHATNG